jgi:3-oxoacyl-[acyl-carrier-protein] synthase II
VIRNDDVFITGFGAVTGAGDEAAWRTAWLAGRSSVRRAEGDDEGLPPGYGAPAAFAHKDLRGLPGGRGLRPGTMTQHTFLAVGAVGRALAHAGLDDPAADADEVADRRGVYLGSYTNFPEMKKHLALVHAMGDPAAAARGDYLIDDARIMDGMRGFTGFDFLKLMNNMPTAHASIQANARGPANTFLGHASVGLQAIARAWDAVRLDLADQFVAGATGPGTLEGLCLLRRALGLLADEGADPATAARPLDRGASGLVPGDGGAAVILETGANAAAGGRSPRARLAGYAELFVVPDGPRGPLPGPAPIVAVARMALQQAGWAASELDYVAAHGSGLPSMDRLEAQALAELVGPGNAWIAAHTGVTGFCEAAHGPLGLVGALQAMEDGHLPPAVNADAPWPALDGRLATSPSRGDVRRALALGLSPEGTLTALAVERV